MHKAHARATHGVSPEGCTIWKAAPHACVCMCVQVCTSMPTTVSTNVVFTQQAGGNAAVALINAVVGNIIGIFVSPGLLTLYLQESGQVRGHTHTHTHTHTGS